MACFSLGVIYFEGLGVKANKNEGGEFLRKLCKANSFIGCVKFARYNQEIGNKNTAKIYFKKACDLGKNSQNFKEISQEICKF